MEGHTNTRYVENHAPRYVDGHVPAVSNVGPTGFAPPAPVEHHPPPMSMVPKTTPNYAVKRVAAQCQFVNTPPSPYSPMATPPLKMMQGNQGQRVVTKTINGTTIGVIQKDHPEMIDYRQHGQGDGRGIIPLTPPPTPQAETCQ